MPVRLPGHGHGRRTSAWTAVGYTPDGQAPVHPGQRRRGLLAGFLSKKIFDQLWGLFDEEEPPDSKHRDIDWRKLLLAAAVQGAIFRAVKEASDHYSRRAFARTTGTWPGRGAPRAGVSAPAGVAGHLTREWHGSAEVRQS